MELSIASQEARVEIQKISNIPPFPSLATELLEVLNDEDADIDTIANVIQKDPALTSRLIGLANSAFFSYERKIYSIQDAMICVLGLDLVKSLSLTICLSGVFDYKKCELFDPLKYWVSSFLTTDLAMRLLPYISTSEHYCIEKDRLYLAGLLHNFGLLILVERFPKLMNEVFQEAEEEPEEVLIKAEDKFIDYNHQDAGVWLAKKWGLPEQLITVMAEYNHNSYRGEYWEDCQLIGLSSRIVRSWLMEKEVNIESESEAVQALQIDTKDLMRNMEKCHATIESSKEMAASLIA